eukprot:4322664-Lingulodinium_polyedra.AAC.1
MTVKMGGLSMISSGDDTDRPPINPLTAYLAWGSQGGPHLRVCTPLALAGPPQSPPQAQRPPDQAPFT